MSHNPTPEDFERVRAEYQALYDVGLTHVAHELAALRTLAQAAEEDRLALMADAMDRWRQATGQPHRALALTRAEVESIALWGALADLTCDCDRTFEGRPDYAKWTPEAHADGCRFRRAALGVKDRQAAELRRRAQEGQRE